MKPINWAIIICQLIAKIKSVNSYSTSIRENKINATNCNQSINHRASIVLLPVTLCL